MTTTSDHLARAAAAWEHMARQDALYAIMTEPGKEQGGWDTDDFFATGKADVHRRMRDLAEALSDAGLPSIGSLGQQALDFGCGVGRLTRALADWGINRVIGLDLAPSMIARAKELSPDPRLDFRVHTPGPLELDDASVDLVFTLITLQHLQTEVQHQYLREFLRVLRPGGCAVIGTMASPLRSPLAHEAPTYKAEGDWTMEMHGMDVSAAVRTLRAAGGRVIDFRMDRAQSEWSVLWVGVTYYVVKPEAAA